MGQQETTQEALPRGREGRDKTVFPNVSNASESSLASEQGPVLAWALEFGLCSGVFGTCRDGDTRGLKSPFSETLQGNICAQTACRTTHLGLSNTYRRGDTLRGSKTKPYSFRIKKDVFLSCFELFPK